MNEPTILDYVKSIFKDRASFNEFLRAVFEQRDAMEMVQMGEVSAGANASEVVETDQVATAASAGLGKFPWLTLSVLVLCLAAQQTFEPPRDLYPIGIVLYFAALGLALFAFRRGEWKVTPLPADEIHQDMFSVRIFAFIASLVLSALTFYSMKDNLFTGINVTLWAGTIFFHLLAFWVPQPISNKQKKFHLGDFFSRSEWTFRITRWGLLVLAVIAVTIFFRTYQLSQVPGEMTSDHAEKLLDVYDITNGKYSIFFPRNTGREPLYIYLCAFFSQWFGLSFLTLKVVAVMGGLLTLPYIYLLGKELGSERIGLLAVAFAGIGYWPSVIERFGLRISFYPLFAAITLYYFFRGIRRQNRNDFILAGVGLGLGLNGYTPFRIMPLVMIVLFAAYFIHLRDGQSRRQVIVWFVLMAFTSWVFFIPLARYWVENPDMFGFRALSRLSTVERPFPAPVWQIFLSNLWIAMKQFNWNNGTIWVHSIPGRPALDVVSAALYLIGSLIVLVRYIRERHWKDLLLLLAAPLLQMPSTLSLAFPDEHPSLNRTGAAIVPVFLLVGIALDTLLNGFIGRMGNASNHKEGGATKLNTRTTVVVLLMLGLFVSSFRQNYDLIFNQYRNQYNLGAWNTKEMGLLMKDFMKKGGSPDQAWIIPYPFWADTRLPLFWAGTVYRGESAITTDKLPETLALPGAKLFMFNMNDTATMEVLRSLYPDGVLTVYQAKVPTKNFYVFRVGAYQ
jgi:4-amino-4-deoxy-L-arabinose transferase-like glycosyltransferase